MTDSADSPSTDSPCILCIDPGASGGLAWTGITGVIRAIKMPLGMTEQCDLIRQFNDLVRQFNPSVLAYIEKVGTYMPGNSGPSAATFAEHCGNLKAALYCYGIPVVPVSPGIWMRHLGALPKGKEKKTARKRAVKELMARKYPHLKVTLATADALGMLSWALRNQSPI